MTTYYDVDEIKEQFSEVISYSQNITNPQIDELFDEWHKNKMRYIQNFGNKLIYESPVKMSVHISEKEQNLKIANLLDILSDDPCVPAEFISYFRQFAHVLFAEKQILDDDVCIGDYRLKKGVKFIKSFKQFIKNPMRLRKYQDMASRLVQESKVEGTLCFSVHPLDYLSISENASNWRSCHALDGEYRAGNLGYMMDGSTVICYLKSDKQVNLPNFPSHIKWNDKKWRMLLYISPSMIMRGKEYPFEAPQITNALIEHYYLYNVF